MLVYAFRKHFISLYLLSTDTELHSNFWKSFWKHVMNEFETPDSASPDQITNYTRIKACFQQLAEAGLRNALDWTFIDIMQHMITEPLPPTEKMFEIDGAQAKTSKLELPRASLFRLKTRHPKRGSVVHSIRQQHVNVHRYDVYMSVSCQYLYHTFHPKGFNQAGIILCKTTTHMHIYGTFRLSKPFPPKILPEKYRQKKNVISHENNLVSFGGALFWCSYLILCMPVFTKVY
jgi:hypothetical protein